MKSAWLGSTLQADFVAHHSCCHHHGVQQTERSPPGSYIGSGPGQPRAAIRPHKRAQRCSTDLPHHETLQSDFSASTCMGEERKHTRQPAVCMLARTLARPKSAILATVPVWSSSTLLGLQSNQIIPRACRYARPRAIPSAMQCPFWYQPVLRGWAVSARMRLLKLSPCISSVTSSTCGRMHYHLCCKGP